MNPTNPQPAVRKISAAEKLRRRIQLEAALRAEIRVVPLGKNLQITKKKKKKKIEKRVTCGTPGRMLDAPPSKGERAENPQADAQQPETPELAPTKRRAPKRDV